VVIYHVWETPGIGPFVDHSLEKEANRMVAILIGIMISIVVGVSLIPTVLSSIAALPTTADTGLLALVDVLPYVFVAVILMGAVTWLSTDS
jgi:uncharacterized membrane protein